MGKEDKQILVVKKEVLFSGCDEFFGFVAHDVFDFEALILKNENYFFTRRGAVGENPEISAEANSSLKQPIRYVLIVNPNLKEVYAYRRKDMNEDPNKIESRLAGKWSWGVGGHIEECDTEGNFIHNSMVREIGEEVELVNGSIKKVLPLGYINDRDSVGLVHFGLLYLVETDAVYARPKSEVSEGAFYTFSQLEEILCDPNCVVEGWSRIAIEPLKKYLQKLS